MCVFEVLLVKGELTAGEVASAVAEAKRYDRAWGLSKTSLHQPHSSAHPSPPCPQTKGQGMPVGQMRWVPCPGPEGVTHHQQSPLGFQD